MRLAEINNPKAFKLSDCKKLCLTIGFNQKVKESLKILDYFFTLVKNPAVSFGGGKDGTAVLILSQMIKPDIQVICADPPNPLPDRETHIENCIHTITPKIERIRYNWDVESVLSGYIKYPEKLKIKKLSEFQKNKNIDGIIWGCRNEESRSRKINFYQRGYIYQVADGTYRCQPIANWSAEEALALALANDYPINPVYEKMDGIYNLNHLHDGTWWPHGDDDKQYWIKRYYPDFYNDYVRAISLDQKRHCLSCRW